MLIARNLARDSEGVAAVEFALLVPILVLLYFGVVELTQGVLTQERAAHAASTVGDLVAQSSSITSAKVTDVFSIGDTVMYPIRRRGLQMRVSSLTADAKGNVTVAWSQANGGMTKLVAGSSVSGLPTNVIVANESVIMAERRYSYASVFGTIMPKPVVFNGKYYLHPRVSSAVICADC